MPNGKSDNKKQYTAEEKKAYAIRMRKLRESKKGKKQNKSRGRIYFNPRMPSSYMMSEMQYLNYMDPALNKNVAPSLAENIGASVPVNSKLRVNLTVGTGTGQIIIYQWTGGKYSVFTCQAGALPLTRYTDPQLDSAQPTSVKFGRASLRLRNLTRADTVAGVVRVLSLPNALDWDFTINTSNLTATFRDELLAMVGSHPETKTYTACEFTKSRRLIVPPASRQGLQDWQDYVGSFLNIDIENQFIQDSAKKMTSNTVIIHLPAVSSGDNNYELTVDQQSLARFPADVLYSNFARQHSMTSRENVDSRNAVLIKHASNFHEHENADSNPYG